MSQRKTLGQYLVRKVQRLYVAASCQLQTFVSSIALKTSLLTFALSSFRVPLLSRASLRATRVRKGQGSEKLDEEGSKDIRVSVLLSNLKWYHSSTLFPKKREKESFKGRYLWRFSFANTFPQFLFHFREQAVESKLKKVIPKVRVFSLPSLSSFSVAMITSPTLCPSPPALYFFKN